MARARWDHLWAWSASRGDVEQLVRLNEPDSGSLDGPVIIAGAHQLGMELLAMRLSMRVNGGVIVDSGADPLLTAARRAWQRFGEQTIIEASGAVRGALRVLKAGRPLLVFPDEPESNDVHCQVVDVCGTRFRYSPIVSTLARYSGAPVIWVQVSQRENGLYDVGFEPLLSAEAACDPHRCVGLQAQKLQQLLLTDPSGYWWSRLSIRSPLASCSSSQNQTASLVADGV